MFIAVFTRARYWSLYWVRLILATLFLKGPLNLHLEAPDIPCSKSYVHFPLSRLFQKIRRNPRPRVIFRIFYGEIASRPTPHLEGHLFSAGGDYLFRIFPATLHKWKSSHPSATRELDMPFWQVALNMVSASKWSVKMISFVSCVRFPCALILKC
jgi:hypothetical protein